MFENIINYKVTTISGAELYKYASQFNFDVTEEQSEIIAKYLRSNRVNIFNDGERMDLIKKIAKETSPKTARQLNKLFLQFKAFE